MTISSNEERDLRADDIGDHPGTGWKLRFWCILTGQGFSLVGSALTQFVLLWWITDTTGSVAALATAGMAALLPQALIGPFGGVLADRYSRRMLMIAADTTLGLFIAAVLALHIAAALKHQFGNAMRPAAQAPQA